MSKDEAGPQGRAPYHPPIYKHVRDAVAAEQIQPQDGWLFLILLSHRNAANLKCNPGLDLLARECGRSREGVKKALNRLRDARLIWWQHTYKQNGNYSSNQYWLTDYAPLTEVRMPERRADQSNLKNQPKLSNVTAKSESDSVPCSNGHIINRDTRQCILCGWDHKNLFVRWAGDIPPPSSESATYRLTNTTTDDEWLAAMGTGAWQVGTPDERYSVHSLLSVPIDVALIQGANGLCNPHRYDGDDGECLLCRYTHEKIEESRAAGVRV